jgi:hypothetical protein
MPQPNTLPHAPVILVVLIKKILYNLYLKTIKRQEAEIQGLVHPAEANPGYFLARFQSLQLP